MNTSVSFPLAKLLKDKGFNEECDSYYNQPLFKETNVDWERIFAKYGHYNSQSNSNDLWFECSAPTIADVVMWLYEKYGIWVSVDFKETDESFQYCCRLIHSNNLPRIFCNDGFNSPTEAYEKAIEYALTNLI